VDAAEVRRMIDRQARIFLLSALLASQATAADWPRHLGPADNNASAETVAAWQDPPEVVWRHEVGQAYSVPIVADGKVFVHATVSGREAEQVTAFDAVTGRELWTDVHERPKFDSQLGDGPRSTPTCESGRLYTYGINGLLSCYEAAGGKRLWQTNPYTDLKAALPNFGVCGSPAVVGDRVIVSVGGESSAVVALDAATGKIVWKEFDEPAASASAVVRKFGPSDAPRVEVIVQTTLRVIGLDPHDGSVNWEHPLVFQPTGVAPTPLVVGNRLICTTQDSGTLVLKLPEEQGGVPEVQEWRQDWAGYFSTGATYGDNRAYLVTNALMPLPSADIRALDVAANKELWRKSGVGYFHVGLTTLADGKLLILDDAGNLLLSQPTDAGLDELCRAKVCGGTFSHHVLAGGRLYVRDGKEVVCYQLPPISEKRSGS
jgi:outer membrane protein assembly factor BamB